MKEDFAAIPRAALAARHRLLREIGDEGVACLAASEVSLDSLSRPAADVARAYLERASVEVRGEGTGDEDVASAHLSGAFFALEHVRRTVGIAGPMASLDVLAALISERAHD